MPTRSPHSGRPRSIQPREASIWLPVLLEYAFSSSDTSRAAQLDLLGIAHDATAYPDDIPSARMAELLLLWAAYAVPTADWRRLQARVRKRRDSAAYEDVKATADSDQLCAP